MATKQETPLINRIIFGAITVIFIFSVLKVVYAYSIGSDTPPYPFWIIFYGFPILGFILTTIKGDIKLRLHKIWTPIGLVMLALTLYRIIFAGSSAGILDTLLINSSESVIYVVALGLLLAFVDLNVLSKYAYFFGVTLIFTIIGVAHDDGYLLQGLPFEGDGLIDQFWFASGILFAYYAVKKFRTEKPSLRKICISVGICVAGVVSFLLIGNLIASFLPSDNWVGHWIKGEKPVYTVTCVGNDCTNPSYADPYPGLCLDAHLIGRDGTSSFFIVAQDHDLVGCGYEIDSASKLITATCTHPIDPIKNNTVSFPIKDCGQNKMQ